MAYKLRLTLAERKAIDWIGHRYFHGDDLYEILTDTDDWHFHTDVAQVEDWGWLADCDITFTLEEHQAWAISGGAASEDTPWSCFPPELVRKMRDFVNSIV